MSNETITCKLVQIALPGVTGMRGLRRTDPVPQIGKVLSVTEDRAFTGIRFFTHSDPGLRLEEQGGGI